MAAKASEKEFNLIELNVCIEQATVPAFYLVALEKIAVLVKYLVINRL